MTNTDKRSEILQSALELIALNGFHGATTALISERAHVGTGTIYRYFVSKEALIYEINKALEKRFRAALMQEYPNGKPLHERIIHVGLTFVRYCLTASLDFRFLEQFHNSPYGVSYRRDRILGETDQGVIVEDLLAEAQKEQIIKDLPKTVLISLFFGPLLCVVRDHILGFTILAEQTINRTVEACWDAIRL
jgi:AcrR family transcriptional regulator